MRDLLDLELICVLQRCDATHQLNPKCIFLCISELHFELLGARFARFISRPDWPKDKPTNTMAALDKLIKEAPGWTSMFMFSNTLRFRKPWSLLMLSLLSIMLLTFWMDCQKTSSARSFGTALNKGGSFPLRILELWTLN